MHKKKIAWAILSGVLLTGAFPKIGLDGLAWIALVPLLYALKDLSAAAGFRVGFITGLVHFLSLLYWLVPVMRTYGYLPMFLSVSVLVLLAAFLALFIARIRPQTCRVPDIDTPDMGLPGIYPVFYFFRIPLGVIGLFPV
ncbi:MAG: hypothetical protein JRD84_09225 [Deltaproteobacteria bacterium]|nr:hypothetical protein [Deltaproteobacteria bacterium]